MAERRLREYRAKRSFKKTPEPSGSRAGREQAGRFVVQEHHARRLHWDLRLERDGVLLSWALPRGLPQDPAEDRLAVHTEDHPVSYLDFEGEIPEGEYGAGRMKIWDRGTYEAEKFEKGKVVVTLRGERTSGRYALFRTRGDDWMIHRMDPPADPDREPMLERIRPMLATLSALPARDDGYGYEIKWDGVRAIAYCSAGRIRLESRNLRDITSQYPEIRGLSRELGSREMVLDGELVALDEDGRPSFQRLQSRMHLTSESVVRRRMARAPVTYMIFDLLYLDGRSTMGLSYEERRSRLEGLRLSGPSWQTPSYHRGQGGKLLKASREQGLEGIIAKRLDSRYAPGRRSAAWLKVKNVRSQEIVIGGWLPGKGRREQTIGALLAGYYEQADGERALRYAGKVGTGFTEEVLRQLGDRLGPLRRDASPFHGRQPPKGSVFVEPRLVGEVEFGEWTAAGTLRHPAFKGLRDDKDPSEVFREQPVPPSEANPGGQRKPASRGRRGGKRAARDAGGRISELGEGPAEIEGRRVKLSNLDKVLYPQAGFTKGDVIDYYARVSQALLPHLQGRPLTLKRYPNGVAGNFFYEKECPPWRPDWVHTAPVWSDRKEREINFCVIDDLPTLVWAANLADLEMHTMLGTAEDLGRPTMMVFDLDPGEGVDVISCARVGLWLRELFSGVGLRTFPKSTGSKGIQVHVPLNTAVTYEETKPFARAVARLLEKQHPDLVVSRMTKKLRAGKVLVDWSQNTVHKSTICAFSLRARERPTVAVPLDWEEVERVAEEEDPEPLRFEAPELLDRLETRRQLFDPVLSLEQRLPDLGRQEQ